MAADLKFVYCRFSQCAPAMFSVTLKNQPEGRLRPLFKLIKYLKSLLLRSQGLYQSLLRFLTLDLHKNLKIFQFFSLDLQIFPTNQTLQVFLCLFQLNRALVFHE